MGVARVFQSPQNQPRASSKFHILKGVTLPPLSYASAYVDHSGVLVHICRLLLWGPPSELGVIHHRWFKGVIMYDTQLESLMVAASRHDTCEWYDDWLYHTVTASSLSSVEWLWWSVTVPWLTVPTTDYDTSWSNVTDHQCHTTPACQHTVYPTSERVPIDPKSQEKKICRKLWSQQVKPRCLKFACRWLIKLVY
jgi:hypothetical protein